MKSLIRKTSRNLLLAGGITLAATAANAQMKIGDNPSVITKSAILELNSTRQGLLLPRVADFTGIDALIGADAVDGMIVYLNSTTAANNGVYMRKAGAWVKIASTADALANWGLTGNAGTTAANYLGTSDNVPLSLRSNATEGISIQTDGSVQLKQVAANTSLLDVLVIDQTTGAVSRRALPASSFKVMTATADSSYSLLNINTTTDPTVAALEAPILAASNPATTKYGFLTKEDWNKLQALSAGNNITIADFITAIAAGDVKKGGKISYDPLTASYKLELLAASTTQAGIVTFDAQSFGGDKTFANNVTVTGTSTLNGAATLNNGADITNGDLKVTTGNLNVAAGTAYVGGTSTLNGVVTLNTVNPTTNNGNLAVLVQDATTKAVVAKTIDMDALNAAITTIVTGGTSTQGASVEFNTGTTGTDFNVVADGAAKTITFNLPDASTTNRGAVTTGTQALAGMKKFTNKVAVGTTDSTTAALLVNGSVSMSIRPVNSTGPITDADYTILASTGASGGITLTLPAPNSAAGTSNVGRIYNIKKVAGGIDNPLTILPGGGTIEGGANYMIYNDWTYITVQSDGTNWYIIKK